MNKNKLLTNGSKAIIVANRSIAFIKEINETIKYILSLFEILFCAWNRVFHIVKQSEY
jgi:hypothetical protein